MMRLDSIEYSQLRFRHADNTAQLIRSSEPAEVFPIDSDDLPTG